jgi:regulatory protein
MKAERKQMTKEQALFKVSALCSQSEKCVQDVRKKMQGWNLPQTDIEDIVRRLVAEHFIDELRYAQFYVRDKVRFSQWGQNKIKYILRAKGIPADCIAAALLELSNDDYETSMESVVKAKFRSLKYKNRYDAKAKLLRFGMGRGFDFDSLSRFVDSLVSSLPTSDTDCNSDCF